MQQASKVYHVPLQFKANSVHFSVDVSFCVYQCVLWYDATLGTLCELHQDMKERHEKETALKAERDVLAKDAANKQAADQASGM